MRKLRVLALCYEGLVPPEKAAPEEVLAARWRTEYDVVSTLRGLGHEVQPIGIRSDLRPLRDAVTELKPHIAFNLLEAFDEVATWDHNVVAFLELLRVPYTGCNARGLMLGRDKAVSKKLLTYHRIGVPEFVTYFRGRNWRRLPPWLAFPLIVKSLTLDASMGISQASVVDSDEKLRERVRFIHEKMGTDALVERYVPGRELYVGVIGNQRTQALPVWELSLDGMPGHAIATERMKSSAAYQEKHGIDAGPAKDLTPEQVKAIQATCKRVYRILYQSGYARIDLRLAEDGKVYVLEDNPNPQLAKKEDFADSAEAAGVSYEDLLQRILNLGMRWEAGRMG